MIRLATKEDRDLVNSIFNDPAVIEHICDDASSGNRPFDFGPLMGTPESAGPFFLTNGSTAVCFLMPMNGTTLDLHSAILPSSRGKQAIQIGHEVIRWIWENTRYIKLLTWIPASNVPAYAFARKCGFAVEGRATMSFMKNGKLQDQILAGLSKGEK